MPAMPGKNLAISIKQSLAGEILSPNFFGPEEWSNFYNIRFSNEQFWSSVRFPWNEDILNSPCPFIKGKKIKETHFGFWGPSYINGKKLTIMKLRKLHPFLFSLKTSWYFNETFVTKTPYNDWYLMPIVTIPDSENRNYEEQTIMLPSEYKVSRVIEEVLKNILYYKVIGNFPNPGKCGRCRNFASDRRRIDVGPSPPPSSRLVIGRYEDNDSSPFLGISVRRIHF